nr:MAG TPA: hypothetical protein [Caudoviricetes sp.]
MTKLFLNDIISPVQNKVIAKRRYVPLQLKNNNRLMPLTERSYSKIHFNPHSFNCSLRVLAYAIRQNPE